SQDVAVLFHRRAAPGGIDDDRVDVVGAKRLEVVPGKLPGRLRSACMEVQCTTAPLVLGDHDFAAVVGEDSCGRPVGSGKEDAADTPREQGDPVAALADGGYDGRQCVAGLVGQSLRQEVEH